MLCGAISLDVLFLVDRDVGPALLSFSLLEAVSIVKGWADIVGIWPCAEFVRLTA